MPSNNFDHLFFSNPPETIAYRPKGRPRSSISTPERSQHEHAAELLGDYDSAWLAFEELKERRSSESLPTREGNYVEFTGAIGFDLAKGSLEHVGQGIRITSVKTTSYGKDKKEALTATVYIPEEKRDYFERKIKRYQESPPAKIRNKILVDSIEDIRYATITSFWQDDLALLPGAAAVWCELWIRTSRGDIKELGENLIETCDLLSIAHAAGLIEFAGRAVLLIEANHDQLVELSERFGFIAELRSYPQPTHHWIESPAEDNIEWIDNLISRLELTDDNKVRIFLLDSGVNNGHPLITPFLEDEDIHIIEEGWGKADVRGHGTNMAGIAIYDNLQQHIESNNPVVVQHRLEAGKIFQTCAGTPEDYIPYVTDQTVSLAEIPKPDMKRIFCLATSYEGDHLGRPTAFSSVIDKLCFGNREHNNQETKSRLFVVAAGNVSHDEMLIYPQGNIRSRAESPAQAFNCITVGAYSNKTVINKQKDAVLFDALAVAGGLSPTSRTSRGWESNSWPQKPDVLFDGGNIAIRKDLSYTSEVDDLMLLTTSNKLKHGELFTTFNATSAATGQAANFAARLWAKYPHARPETIRALMVHSAEWNSVLLEDFLDDPKKKGSYEDLMRTCGHGIPNLQKALHSSESNLVFVMENSIQPFILAQGKSTPKLNETHFIELPFPKQILIDLGAAEVRMKITLSYHLEPSPGNLGYTDRYVYPSHGLRFDVNNTNENLDTFKNRLIANEDPDAEKVKYENDSDRWLMGANVRNRGTINSDQIISTAAELATCNYIAVIPTTGWWKTRKSEGKYHSIANYSLIVSLDTKATDIDIYTPVANTIKAAIAIHV